MEGLERELRRGFYSQMREQKPVRAYDPGIPRFLRNRASFKRRSHTIFGVLCLASVAALFSAYGTLAGLNASVGKKRDRSYERVLLAHQLEVLSVQLLLAERDLLAEDLVEGMRQRARELNQSRKEFQTTWAQLRPEVSSDYPWAVELDGAWSSWLALNDEVQRQATEGDIDAAISHYREASAPVRESFRDAMDNLGNEVRGAHENAQGLSAELYERYRTRLMWAGLLTMLLVFYCAFLLQKMSVSMGKLGNAMRRHGYEIQKSAELIHAQAQPADHTPGLSLVRTQVAVVDHAQASDLAYHAKQMLLAIETPTESVLAIERISASILKTVESGASAAESIPVDTQRVMTLKEQSQALRHTVVAFLEEFEGVVGGERSARPLNFESVELVTQQAVVADTTAHSEGPSAPSGEKESRKAA